VYFSRSQQLIIALCLVVLLAAAGVWLYTAGLRQAHFEAEELFTPAPVPPVEAARQKDVLVHVCGRVRRPGVYRLKPHNRVLEAIKAAGGALPDGDMHALNLAALVEDGDRLYVPTKEEAQAALVQATLAEAPAPAAPTSPSPAPSPPSPAPARKATATSAPPSPKPKPRGKININKATPAQLQALPGIGPVMAQRIVAYRQQKGAFTKPEDLLDVSGIGPKTFAKMKEFVTVE